MTIITNMNTLETDRVAIARLYVRGYINEATKKKAYVKLERNFEKFEAREELRKFET